MRSSYLSCGAIVVAAALAACAELPPTGPMPERAPSRDVQPFCRELCLDPVDPAVTGPHGWPFFGRPNDVMYEAPGDPSPGSPGVWLGSAVTPAACFNDLTRNVVDADQDWLDDRCEFELAKGFAPRWSMGFQDNCPEGEPAWAAKYFPAQRMVRIAFLPAYYADCGVPDPIFGQGGGHPGDSEIVMLQVVYNDATRHWELQTMFLSAHLGVPDYIVKLSANGWWVGDRIVIDRSAWVAASDAEYSASSRYLAYPKIAVSANKHANYATDSKCNNTLAGSAGFGDACYGSDLTPFRFPIDGLRNVGSRHRDLFGGCIPSYGQFAGNGKLECFFTPSYGFAGWTPGIDGETPYYQLLMSGHFEYLGTDPGPGPAPASLVRATIEGVGSITRAGEYEWTAVPSNCNPTCTYSWRFSSDNGATWSGAQAGPWYSAYVDASSGRNLVVELTVFTDPGESFVTRKYVAANIPATCPNFQRFC